jgi:hypothetical protein
LEHLDHIVSTYMIPSYIMLEEIVLPRSIYSNSSVKHHISILKDIQTNKTLYEFLWNRNRDNVKREISTKSYEDGGLKMIDIIFFLSSIDNNQL